MMLIIGLGNPGQKYRLTRHNVGFRCVDFLAGLWDIPLNERRAKAIVGHSTASGRSIVLAKPRTFVNRSGEAVRYLLDRFSAKPTDLLIISDDMDLPLGNIRLRAGGGAGGHKGLQSIIDSTATNQFPRLRLGIGRPQGAQHEIDFVLGSFEPLEQMNIKEAVERAAEAIIEVLQEGIEAAMNRFNQS